MALLIPCDGAHSLRCARLSSRVSWQSSTQSSLRCTRKWKNFARKTPCSRGCTDSVEPQLWTRVWTPEAQRYKTIITSSFCSFVHRFSETRHVAGSCPQLNGHASHSYRTQKAHPTVSTVPRPIPTLYLARDTRTFTSPVVELPFHSNTMADTTANVQYEHEEPERSFLYPIRQYATQKCVGACMSAACLCVCACVWVCACRSAAALCGECSVFTDAITLCHTCLCSPLKLGFGIWGTGMVATGIYLWKYKSHRPLSQNIIHARMVAQFGVIVGLCSGALISYLELPKQSRRATSEDRLVAIGNAHSAAFKEELEIERYEAQMKAMEVEAALARKAAASQEAAAPAECSTPAPAPLP